MFIDYDYEARDSPPDINKEQDTKYVVSELIYGSVTKVLDSYTANYLYK